jgi:hypothetical protein
VLAEAIISGSSQSEKGFDAAERPKKGRICCQTLDFKEFWFVARIHYIGKNGVPPAPTELELKKIEAAETQNALNRAKLERMRGELIPRREVEFVSASAVVILRQQLLTLPSRLVSELRPHLASENLLFTVQRCVDGLVRGWLGETTDLLMKTPVAAKAILEMEARESGVDPEAETKKSESAVRKRDAANAKRREKRRTAAK